MSKKFLQKGIRNRNSQPVTVWIRMLVLVMVAVLLAGCRSDVAVKPDAGQKTEVEEQELEAAEKRHQESAENRLSDENVSEEISEENLNHPVEEKSVVQPEGTVMLERFMTPEGFERAEAEGASFESFLRQFPLKEAGSPVLLHNGKEKGNQSAHAAVFALPIEDVDLQQWNPFHGHSGGRNHLFIRNAGRRCDHQRRKSRACGISGRYVRKCCR